MPGSWGEARDPKRGNAVQTVVRNISISMIADVVGFSSRKFYGHLMENMWKHQTNPEKLPQRFLHKVSWEVWQKLRDEAEERDERIQDLRRVKATRRDWQYRWKNDWNMIISPITPIIWFHNMCKRWNICSNVSILVWSNVWYKWCNWVEICGTWM